jgi:3-dehydroquinate dehydratase/shikimate dehydrogenase
MDGKSRPALAPRQNGVRPAAGRSVSIMAVLAAPPADSGGYLKAAYLKHLTSAVGYMEVRADLVGDLDPAALRAYFPGALIYTLRSAAAGGGCADPADRRRARLIAAAGWYDYVDIEAPRDLHPDVLAAIAPERRILTWPGPAPAAPGAAPGDGAATSPVGPAALRRVFDTLAAVPARLYRLAPQAETLPQAAAAPLFLKSLARDDVMAYARGPSGTWTRVLTAKYGAPLASGWLDDAAAADLKPPPPDGELPLPRLLADYPGQLLAEVRRLYGIIGGQVTMSLATRMYNAACRSLRLPALFLPFSTQELPRSLEALRADLDELGLPLCGATVVRPHKENAVAVAHDASEVARVTGSASLLVRNDGAWWADNEAAGVVGALRGNGIDVAGRQVAVVGCGGAGRAAAAGLSRAGAEVTLVNRGARRGERAAAMLGLPLVLLRDFDPRPFSVLVHATPAVDEPPVRPTDLDPGAVVFDLNYRTRDTPLIAAARAAGHVTIDGRDMLLAELPRQFRLMTGRSMPPAEAGAALARTEG